MYYSSIESFTGDFLLIRKEMFFWKNVGRQKERYTTYKKNIRRADSPNPNPSYVLLKIKCNEKGNATRPYYGIVFFDAGIRQTITPMHSEVLYFYMVQWQP